MRRFLPLYLAISLVLAAGFVHGRWIDRWGQNGAVEAAVARLARVPKQVGNWQGHDQQLAREVITKAGLDGYILRRFESPQHGFVTVLLVCGRPGPISAHTPEVCYGGAGFEPLTEPIRKAFTTGESETPAEFFTTMYTQPRKPDQADLRLLWAWNGNGSWEVADNPRLSFAPYRSLYKLYITREIPRNDQLETTQDIALDFARQFLPILKQSLF